MLKIISMLMVVLGSVNAKADSFEVLGGGITYHLMDNGGAVHNTNKLSSDGRLISNPMLGLVYVQESGILYKSYAVFGGENSVGLPMGGMMHQRGVALGNFQFGAALGFYLQDDVEFKKSGAEPFKMAEINGTGVVPVLGFSANYKIKLSQGTYLRINNVISPVITNTSLSFGWNF